MSQRPVNLSGIVADDVELLITRIGASDHTELPGLCEMLAEIEDPRAGDALRRLTGHEDPVIRSCAVGVLSARLGEPATVTALRHALGDPRAVVVLAALDLVEAHELSSFRNELRALSAMPNEDASSAWIGVANRAMSVLAGMCTVEDLDLGVRAFADAKLEDGGTELLAGLLIRLPVEKTAPLLQGQRALCAQVLPRLMAGAHSHRLEELAESGIEPAASLAASCLRLGRAQPELRYVPAAERTPLRDIRPVMNDGMHDLDYELCTDAGLNGRLSMLLNEACHVFRAHADGNWKSEYKDSYAERVRDEICANPWLIKRLFALKDRVIASLVYRAIELRDG